MNCINCGKQLSKEKYKRCMVCNGIHKRGVTLINRICDNCGKEFQMLPCYLKRGKQHGKYCTKKCRAITEYPKRSGFKEANYKITHSQSGSNNHRWKGGITPFYKSARLLLKYKQWRLAVFARDKSVCQKCHEAFTLMIAHHINSFANHPELRTEVSNGVTLCKECHHDFHHIYTNFNNTEEQWLEFLSL